jgi:hypothetical protein
VTVRAHRILLWAGFCVLLLLHLDFWRPQRVVLHFGWVPEELLYRVSWMVLAWIYLLYVCARHWREER